MKNTEFAKNYGVAFNPVQGQIYNIRLYPFQEMILDNLEDLTLPKTIINSGRQSGVSTALALHISNFLIHNRGFQNEIYIKSVNLSQIKYLMDKIKIILNEFYGGGDYYIKNNQYGIELINGNKLICTSNSLNLAGRKVEKIHSLIIDNALFIKNLDGFLDTFIKTPKINLKKLVIASTTESYLVDAKKETKDLLKKVEKPPLGLMPWGVWEAVVNKRRIEKIKDAIKRYLEANHPIPPAWITELNERNKK